MHREMVKKYRSATSKLLARRNDRHELLGKDPQLLTSFRATNPTARSHILRVEGDEDILQVGSRHQTLDGGDTPR